MLTSITCTRVPQGFSPSQVALFIFSLVLWAIKLTNFMLTIGMVWADSDRTQQVIRNLLSNAMRLQVLVVDDEDDNRKIITLALLEYNVKVRTANCAMAATEIVTQENLDAIVSDIGMPNQNGYELIKKIRDWKVSQGLKPVGAIALTAYARDEDCQRAISHGFQMYLFKPIEPHKLALAISQLANSYW